MRWLYTLPLRLRSLFGWSAVERDLDEELQYHVDRQTEANVAAGMNGDEARRAAMRAMGGITRPMEECRDVHRDSWGLRLFDTLARDVKHAIRRLARDWQFTLAAVLILALGIGINSAVFSVVNALLFRTQPFPDSDRLVNLYQNVGGRAEPAGVSFPTYRDMAASTGVFSAVAAVLPSGVEYQGQLAFAEYLTSNYLQVAGHAQFAGRWFTEAEDRLGAAPTAVIGYRTWQSKFRSDLRILGQTIRLNNVPVTIVGIGPGHLASASHPTLIADFSLPMSAIDSVGSHSNLPEVLDRRGQFVFEVRARLKRGVSVTEAHAAMNVLAQRLATDYPDSDPGKGITVVRTDSVVIHPGEQDLWMTLLSTTLLIIVGLVLAIACSNLATLLLVRGTNRAKEVSVRLAMGATRWQLISHLLTESVLLSLCGASAGLVLCNWTIRYLAALIPVSFDLHLDYRVLVFTLAISLVTGITLGLAPALRSTRVDLLSALRGESTPSSLSPGQRWFTMKNVLLVTQVAGSFLLLMGTAYVVRMVTSMRSQDPGFAVQGVALADISPRLSGYDQAASERLHKELRRRIAEMPGVQAVFTSAGSPVGSNVSREIEIDGPPGAGTPGSNTWRFGVKMALASPGYFETLQIPLLHGRTLQESDVPGRPLVAIVNETLARRIFGTPNAVGRRFRYGDAERSQEAKIPVEISGVVRDTAGLDPGTGSQAVFFLPAAQTGAELSTLVVRTSGDAAGFVKLMQREIRALDATLPVRARTMEQQLENDLQLWNWAVGFVGGMGLVALALASVGLYAVVRFAVSKRSVEFGIRMALGARNKQIVWLVMKEITILIGMSTMIGSAGSVAVMALAPSLIETPSTVHLEALPGVDPVAMLAVFVVMVATAGAAAYFPARRAANADPSVSLRRQ